MAEDTKDRNETQQPKELNTGRSDSHSGSEGTATQKQPEPSRIIADEQEGEIADPKYDQGARSDSKESNQDWSPGSDVPKV